MVMNNFGIGGVQQVWRKVLPYLTQQYSVHLVAYKSDQGSVEEFEKAGIKTHFLPSHGRLHWKTIRDYRNFFKAVGANIVHSNSHSPNVFCPIAAKLAQVPVCISHIHTHADYWFSSNKLGKYKQNLEESLVHRYLSQKILTVSQVLWEKYSKEMFVPKDKFMVMHNGIELNQLAVSGAPAAQSLPPEQNLRQKLNMQPEELLLGFMGRLSKIKGLDYLLDFAKELSLENFLFKIVIFGSGEEQDIALWQAAAKLIGDGQRVIFMGATSTPELYYPQMDAFLFTSQPGVEGMPTVLLEAASYNLPIITRKDGFETEILPYYNRWVIIEDFPTKLQAVQAAMHLPAVDLTALHHFSAAAMAERLHSLYQSCLVVELAKSR